MDDIWENTETTQRGNPKEFPQFYETVMDDINLIVKMTSFEANKLDSQKYLNNPGLRDFVKDFAFDLLGELSANLDEPMDAFYMVDSFVQFAINQVEKK
jgi:hypothetical protein